MKKIIIRKIISNLIKIKKMAGFYALLEILFKNSRSKKNYDNSVLEIRIRI